MDQAGANKIKGRSSTEEPRDEEDTTVVEPDQNNGMASAVHATWEVRY